MLMKGKYLCIISTPGGTVVQNQVPNKSLLMYRWLDVVINVQNVF